MKERYTYMDWAKAIGIALICIGHFLPHGYPPKVVMYAFHVPLFAFVSGLLTTAPKSLLAALKKLVSSPYGSSFRIPSGIGSPRSCISVSA